MAWWKPYEEAYLLDHAGDGAKAIADALGRTVSGVQTHASRMGVSLYTRWYCPKCGRHTYKPLSDRTGWCRACTIQATGDTAALKNAEIRKEVAEEKERERKEERRRQMLYSDSYRQKSELRRLRGVCNRNANTEGKAND